MSRNRPISWQLWPGKRICQHVLRLTIVLLTWQLCAMGFHHHALAEKTDDCVSCQLAAEDLPPPPLLLHTLMSASLSFFIYCIVCAPLYFFIAAICAYLGPYSQAPPSV